MYSAEFAAVKATKMQSAFGIIDGLVMHDLVEKSQAVSSLHYAYYILFSFRLTHFLPFCRF